MADNRNEPLTVVQESSALRNLVEAERRRLAAAAGEEEEETVQARQAVPVPAPMTGRAVIMRIVGWKKVQRDLRDSRFNSCVAGSYSPEVPAAWAGELDLLLQNYSSVKRVMSDMSISHKLQSSFRKEIRQRRKDMCVELNGGVDALTAGLIDMFINTRSSVDDVHECCVCHEQPLDATSNPTHIQVTLINFHDRSDVGHFMCVPCFTRMVEIFYWDDNPNTHIKCPLCRVPITHKLMGTTTYFRKQLYEIQDGQIVRLARENQDDRATKRHRNLSIIDITGDIPTEILDEV
jgi:hypothetical protein